MNINLTNMHFGKLNLDGTFVLRANVIATFTPLSTDGPNSVKNIGQMGDKILLFGGVLNNYGELVVVNASTGDVINVYKMGYFGNTLPISFNLITINGVLYFPIGSMSVSGSAFIMVFSDLESNGFLSLVPMDYIANTGLSSAHSSTAITYSATTYSLTPVTASASNSTATMVRIP